MWTALGDVWAGLTDLVLPARCAGCGQTCRGVVCGECADRLRCARPGPVSPTPAPPGLPDCLALGPYAGVLRQVLLAYKERGRHDLAGPLGVLLAAVVSAGAPRGPLILVPVPATAVAARQRYGDHLRRLAGPAASALRRAGWAVAVCPALGALPRVDSAGLDAASRARTAAVGFTVRPDRIGDLRRLLASGARQGAGSGHRTPVTVVLLDDIVTTGATLAATAGTLAAKGVPVGFAAVLAATRRHTDYDGLS